MICDLSLKAWGRSGNCRALSLRLVLYLRGGMAMIESMSSRKSLCDIADNLLRAGML